MDVHYADPAVAAFIVIPLVLVGLLVWAVFTAGRIGTGTRAAGSAAFVAVVAAGWMAVTWMAAASGVLREWERRPPPFALLVAAIVLLGAALAFGPVGRRIVTGVPLWALVAVQAFRLPLELAMHAMYERGVMPVQMSYSGRNFDIVTGATAIVVAALVATRRSGRPLVWIWNLLGLALLVNVVTVAILSTPALRYFGDDRLNVWITYPPFVWLPAVMVLAAWAGHLLIFRALGTASR